MLLSSKSCKCLFPLYHSKLSNSFVYIFFFIFVNIMLSSVDLVKFYLFVCYSLYTNRCNLMLIIVRYVACIYLEKSLTSRLRRWKMIFRKLSNKLQILCCTPFHSSFCGLYASAFQGISQLLIYIYIYIYI